MPSASLSASITEVSRQMVTLADGHQLKAPKIAPIEIAFENRAYVSSPYISKEGAGSFLMILFHARS
jgi:hypothetical protein